MAIVARNRLVVDMKKVVPIKELFGLAKFKKSAQQTKDELRVGWD